jgi:undecaprenyl-diphosphatase
LESGLIERLYELDLYVTLGLNGFAGQNELLDDVVHYINDGPFFKGLPAMMLFWAAWSLSSEPTHLIRAKLTALLPVAAIALALGKALAIYLPFRTRPIQDPEVPHNLPIGVRETTLDGWSSMPSDHAVLFFCVAAGVWLVNRRIGMLSFAHAILVATLPRVYLSYHYISDILVGAAIGLALTFLLVPPFTRLLIRGERFWLHDRLPWLLYPIVFFSTFQMATLFRSARQFAEALIVKGASLF